MEDESHTLTPPPETSLNFRRKISKRWASTLSGNIQATMDEKFEHREEEKKNDEVANNLSKGL